MRKKKTRGTGHGSRDPTSKAHRIQAWQYVGTFYAGVVFLLFGYGTKRQHLGSGHARTCPRCHNTTQWARMREFKQFTLFFIPVARWKRLQLEECGICGATIEG